MNVEELSKLYDLLYQQAEMILKLHDPCKFWYKGCLQYNFEKNPYCCCRDNHEDGQEHLDHCIHWEVGIGCTVEALSCKLWTCHHVDNKAVEHSLMVIENIAREYKLLGFRSSKEEIFRRIENEKR